jgi:hypothetical protein
MAAAAAFNEVAAGEAAAAALATAADLTQPRLQRFIPVPPMPKTRKPVMYLRVQGLQSLVSEQSNRGTRHKQSTDGCQSIWVQLRSK